MPGEKIHKNFQFLVFCNALDLNNGKKLKPTPQKMFGRTVHKTGHPTIESRFRELKNHISAMVHPIKILLAETLSSSRYFKVKTVVPF